MWLAGIKENKQDGKYDYNVQDRSNAIDTTSASTIIYTWSLIIFNDDYFPCRPDTI